MRWFVREASLATALGALILLVRPAWLPLVIKPWLVIVGLLASGAIISRAFARVPAELQLVAGGGSVPPRQLGRVRQMSDIDQGSDFLLAVDYQLFPFLQSEIKAIAVHRLLVNHNVVLDRQPELARNLLGDAVWQLVRPPYAGEGQSRWGNITFAHLSALARDLEAL